MAMMCVTAAHECVGCMCCMKSTEVVHRCTQCGDEIYEGHTYFAFQQHPYCCDCITVETAELDEEY